jgi:hypothetical protein
VQHERRSPHPAVLRRVGHSRQPFSAWKRDAPACRPHGSTGFVAGTPSVKPGRGVDLLFVGSRVPRHRGVRRLSAQRLIDSTRPATANRSRGTSRHCHDGDLTAIAVTALRESTPGPARDGANRQTRCLGSSLAQLLHGQRLQRFAHRFVPNRPMAASCLTERIAVISVTARTENPVDDNLRRW